MVQKPKKSSIFDLIESYIENVEAFADELFASVAPESPSWSAENCCLHALSNVLVTPSEVIVTADFPNIEPDTVKVELVDDDFIMITAKMKKKVRFADLGIYHRQGEFSSIRCQSRVTTTVDFGRMKVTFRQGVVEVRLPRKKEI